MGAFVLAEPPCVAYFVSMSHYPALGEFEHMVLLAVLRLEGNAYAPAILEEIEARTGRAASRGSIYVTLDRLEEKGLLSSVMDAGGAERGGRRRRRLKLTAPGLAALRASREAMLRMWQGMEERLGRGRA
jgi:DNA-binding PadR family transcriptional regulator